MADRAGRDDAVRAIHELRRLCDSPPSEQHPNQDSARVSFQAATMGSDVDRFPGRIARQRRGAD